MYDRTDFYNIVYLYKHPFKKVNDTPGDTDYEDYLPWKLLE